MDVRGAIARRLLGLGLGRVRSCWLSCPAFLLTRSRSSCFLLCCLAAAARVLAFSCSAAQPPALAALVLGGISQRPFQVMWPLTSPLRSAGEPRPINATSGSLHALPWSCPASIVQCCACSSALRS